MLIKHYNFARHFVFMAVCVVGLYTVPATLTHADEAEALTDDGSLTRDATIADEYITAMSDEDLANILSKMVFPTVDKNSKVHCELTVTSHGRTDNERCFSNIKPSAKYTRFYRRLKRTLTTAELRPAHKNGIPVEVNMQFSFVFLSENESEFKLVKNDGRLWDQIGVDYVAPQRLTQITPYSCPEFTRIKHKCDKRGISYFYVWDVDTTGLGTNCRAISTTKEDIPGIDHCQRTIRFIPGTVKDQRVVMPLVESFGFVE